VQIPVPAGQERVLPVLVMTLAFSRFLTATMIPSRQAGGILSGMWQLINGVGPVTKTLAWDREAAIGVTARVSAAAAAFTGTLATWIRLALPRDRTSRAWSSATTGSSGLRSFRAAVSARRPTSTPSSPHGCWWRTRARSGRSRGFYPFVAHQLDPSRHSWAGSTEHLPRRTAAVLPLMMGLVTQDPARSPWWQRIERAAASRSFAL
jgi:hypothetical protein